MTDFYGRTIEVGDTIKVRETWETDNKTYIGTLVKVMGNTSMVKADPSPVFRPTREVRNYNIIRWEPEDRI